MLRTVFSLFAVGSVISFGYVLINGVDGTYRFGGEDGTIVLSGSTILVFAPIVLVVCLLVLGAMRDR